MHEYIIMYSPSRADFLDTMTAAEAGALQAHYNYLQSLLGEGKLILAGRREDAEYNIAVIRAENETDAQRIATDDPVVASGVFRATIAPFLVSLTEAQGG